MPEMGVSNKVAERIRKGEDFAKNGLNVNRIKGMNRKNFLSVSFLALARSAARSVARIVWDFGKESGSGFMISDKLFLTSGHVIPTQELARRFFAEFNYEEDFLGNQKSVSKFKFDPETFFITSHEDNLDYTLIAIDGKGDGNPGNIQELKDFGYCPLSDANDKNFIGQFVNIVHHPKGYPKQIALRENQLLLLPGNVIPDKVLLYYADVKGGSSGSPVFNDQFMPVALHHRGEPHPNTVAQSEICLPKYLKEGIRISAIVLDLKKRQGELSTKQRELLKAALQLAESNPYPSKMATTD